MFKCVCETDVIISIFQNTIKGIIEIDDYNNTTYTTHLSTFSMCSSKFSSYWMYECTQSSYNGYI